MKKMLSSGLLGATLLALSVPAIANDYVIDTKGAHASINFKIQHLGYSWLIGNFEKFNGEFSYDEGNPAATKVSVSIDPSSVNTNHAERDKHIRSKDFLDVSNFSQASFTSTSFETSDGKSGKLHGKLTLRDVTKDIVIDVVQIGEGKDPWGGYRAGFEGNTTLTLKDFGVPMDLGPKSATIQMNLHVEGIRK